MPIAATAAMAVGGVMLATASPVSAASRKGKCVKNNAASVWNRSNLKPGQKNQNASHQFSPSSRTNMSYGLHTPSSGRITCGYDGYTSTPGRHEGIDLPRGGLSTISIYSASLNKTVSYLHAAPRGTLRVGQTVSRGQIIADESWRGVSSRRGAHAHVEMRLGRQARAAKSVNDWRLENPNPTPFWNSQGYNVR
ncbi:hypothetical protein SMC26_25395 [Actinomadura fulvescens]